MAIVKGKEIPDYVMLNKTALRYDKKSKRYVRDNGNWSVGFKWENGKLFSISKIKIVQHKELTPTTQKFWHKDNYEN